MSMKVYNLDTITGKKEIIKAFPDNETLENVFKFAIDESNKYNNEHNNATIERINDKTFISENDSDFTIVVKVF